MTQVVLHGYLREEFGESFEGDVHSITEAVRFLCGNMPDIREVLRSGAWHIKRVYQGMVLDVGEDMLTFEMRDAPIHIYPAVEGSGGTAKTIIGFTLMVASFFLPAPLGMLAFSIGASLAVSGIAMLLSPGRKGNATQGSTGSTTQLAVEGDAIPCVFGRFMAIPKGIASQLIETNVNVGSTNFIWYVDGATNPVYDSVQTGTYSPLFSG